MVKMSVVSMAFLCKTNNERLSFVKEDNEDCTDYIGFN